MRAFKKKQMKAFLCPYSGHSWSGVSGSPQHLLVQGLQPHLSCSVHHPIPAHFSMMQVSHAASPLFPHVFLPPPRPCSASCKQLLLHLLSTQSVTQRDNVSSPHLLSALKYVCKVSVCAVHAYRAKTCPSRPTQAPTMAAMTNHRSASLYPSPGGCCCFYSLKF